MTETLSPPSAEPEQQRRPPVVVGALAALRAGLGGLLLVVVVVLAGWAADDRSGAAAAQVLRAGMRVWLLAHGTVLELPLGRFSLVPLGLTVLPLALLWRAGRSASRGLRAVSVGGALRAALVVVAPYAALTGAVALLAGTPTVEPSPVSAVAGGGLVALVGAGAGALSRDRVWRAAWLRRGERTRRTLLAAGTAGVALLGAGALLVGGSLAVHAGRTAELFAVSAPGPLAGAALLLMGLAYAPEAVLWAACWLAGPGFSVGAGTAVGPFGTELAAVPALPLLAALPSGALPPWVGALVLLVPLTAGGLAGRALHRVTEGLPRTAVALDVTLTALWSGGAVAVLAVLAGGAAGGARLAQVGPSGWQCGLAVAAEVGVGASLVLWRLRRRVTPG